MISEGILDLTNALAILKLWAKKDGDTAFSPLIDNPNEFTVEWRSWWRSLQPASQIGAREWPLLKVGLTLLSADWDALKKGSSRGFVLVLLSLTRWEENLRSAKDRKAFQMALEDVYLVLQVLSGTLKGKTTSLKRVKTNGMADVHPKRYIYGQYAQCAIDYNNLLKQGVAEGGQWCDDEISSPSASVLRPHSSDSSDRGLFSSRQFYSTFNFFEILIKLIFYFFGF